MKENGKFIISLDFELHWGGVEIWNLKNWSQYFMETRRSIPIVLKIFEENEIRATWATVGFLFAKDKQQIHYFTPKNKPIYKRENLSTYNYFSKIGNNEADDPFHYGYSLINKIIKTKGQEVATHTFSHYYCKEIGQTVEQFEEDLIAAQTIARENFGLKLKSLVFPRNQYNNQYLTTAKRVGIKIVRSNPNVWFWNNSYSILTPLIRATDTLFDISPSLAFENPKFKQGEITELPASRFFRPFKKNEKLIQNIKLNRIKKEMTYAAKNKLVYHLWWHPHNFGGNVSLNLFQLREIIKHFKKLNKEFGFDSLNMNDLANKPDIKVAYGE